MEQNKKERADIIELPIKPRFSSGEINSLFLGLCRLVRRMAAEEAEEHFKRKLSYAEASLKAQIKNLQMINKGLMHELNKKNKAE